MWLVMNANNDDHRHVDSYHSDLLKWEPIVHADWIIGVNR